MTNLFLVLDFCSQVNIGNLINVYRYVLYVSLSCHAPHIPYDIYKYTTLFMTFLKSFLG